MNEILDGNEILSEAINRLKINLLELVAMTSIWVSPETCRELKAKKGSSTRYPNVRRGRSNEEKGSIISGIRIDDNTYANGAIKSAIGIKKADIKNFNTCHIYPNTCYDERYHTKLENLVLLPNAIAQLSDNYDNVIKILQYRAFELYGWYPEELEEPQKPTNYPTKWREPVISKSFSEKELIEQEKEIEIEASKENYIQREKDEIEKVEKRVPKWFKENGQKNHIVLVTFLELLLSSNSNTVSKNELKEICDKYVDKFGVNFNQMINFGKNNHAKVFEYFDGEKDKIYLWEPVAKFILSEYQKYLENNK